MRLIHLPVVKIDIPVRTAYNKAIAAATPGNENDSAAAKMPGFTIK